MNRSRVAGGRRIWIRPFRTRKVVVLRRTTLLIRFRLLLIVRFMLRNRLNLLRRLIKRKRGFPCQSHRLILLSIGTWRMRRRNWLRRCGSLNDRFVLTVIPRVPWQLKRIILVFLIRRSLMRWRKPLSVTAGKTVTAPPMARRSERPIVTLNWFLLLTC